jgi:Zn finger protein HypA/HybF involved in hydrogenase expression
MKYSLAFIIAAAIGFALIPGSKVESMGKDSQPVKKAVGGEVLSIDGNRNMNGVVFPHHAHIVRNGGELSCAKCHHMNKPLDEESGCWECHTDMFMPSDAFGHDWHGSPAGANISCSDCHSGEGYKSADNTKDCLACHKDLFPAHATIQVTNYNAPGYTDAMHGLCVQCHQFVADTSGNIAVAQCAACHGDKLAIDTVIDYQKLKETRDQNWISLPNKSTK